MGLQDAAIIVLKKYVPIYCVVISYSLLAMEPDPVKLGEQAAKLWVRPPRLRTNKEWQEVHAILFPSQQQQNCVQKLFQNLFGGAPQPETFFIDSRFVKDIREIIWHYVKCEEVEARLAKSGPKACVMQLWCSSMLRDFEKVVPYNVRSISSRTEYIKYLLAALKSNDNLNIQVDLWHPGSRGGSRIIYNLMSLVVRAGEDPELVDHLIKMGCDPHDTPKVTKRLDWSPDQIFYLESPITVAEKRGYTQIVEKLKEYSAQLEEN